jgi:hypothetical protein
MAKTTPSKDSTTAGPPVASVEEKKEATAEVTLKKEEEQPVSFSRWFVAKGFRAHWKEGMAAFTDITLKRTMSDWDKVFKAY